MDNIVCCLLTILKNYRTLETVYLQNEYVFKLKVQTKYKSYTNEYRTKRIYECTKSFRAAISIITCTCGDHPNNLECQTRIFTKLSIPKSKYFITINLNYCLLIIFHSFIYPMYLSIYDSQHTGQHH